MAFHSKYSWVLVDAACPSLMVLLLPPCSLLGTLFSEVTVAVTAEFICAAMPIAAHGVMSISCHCPFFVILASPTEAQTKMYAQPCSL